MVQLHVCGSIGQCFPLPARRTFGSLGLPCTRVVAERRCWAPRLALPGIGPDGVPRRPLSKLG